MKIKNAIFSGRFDPIHIGHILTGLKLFDKYLKVIYVVLNYEGRFLSAQKSKKIIDEIFKHNYKGEVVSIINDTHFAKIQKTEYLLLLNNFNN